jgi:hypothetical protein
VQKAALIGHIVEDLAYENIDPARFQAELVGRAETPVYKREGFFVFSNLARGQYILKITGQRFQPEIIQALLPAAPAVPVEDGLEGEVSTAPLFLDSRGDNELIVVVRTTEDVGGNNGGQRINFDPVILNKEIRAGARVFSSGLPADSFATLAATLESGEISSARIENAEGIEENSIIRIVRDASVRMKFDSYYLFPSPITRIVGKVVSERTPETSLAGARVRITGINDSVVTRTEVGGVGIFTGLNTSGNVIVLGAEKDISAVTNEKGDYNIYFSNETMASFRITDQTLTDLEAAGVPVEARAGLESLRNRFFRGLERFGVALRETLGDDDARRYGALIQALAENFIRTVSIDAALEGYEVASRTEPISTGQRKTINFRLARA